MAYISYIVIYAFLKLLSWLPMPILYFLSDICYFLIYKLFKYRVKIVRKNLKIAFPNDSDSQRKLIEEKFYRHFCDLFLEMVKTLSMSKETMRKRFAFTNLELIKAYEKKGKSIILKTPHYANWEWAIILGTYLNIDAYGIYKPLQNKYFDRLVKNIRSKFNASLLSIDDTISVMKSNEEHNRKGLYLFLSDQNPIFKRNTHWEKFMGQLVPVHMGAELLARKLDLNVLYLKTTKVKRGYYQATFIELTSNAKELATFELTRSFFDEVENQIRETPYLYFWTHNRWKHTEEKYRKTYGTDTP